MYQPVLANRRLDGKFGYLPRKTSREVFDFFLAARRAGDA
jgi:UDP-glucose 4-epimerase